ncbi:hypothetical protein H0A36_27455, partial [Endozoicomonas sp. SM1973]
FVSPKSTIKSGKVGHGSFSLSLPVGTIKGLLAALSATSSVPSTAEDCQLQEECKDCNLT